MAALLDEMTGHGESHDAETDECDFCHELNLSALETLIDVKTFALAAGRMTRSRGREVGSISIALRRAISRGH
jgi:hypothetical protein